MSAANERSMWFAILISAAWASLAAALLVAVKRAVRNFASSRAPPYNQDGKLPRSLKDSDARESQQESADGNAAARSRGLSTKARWLWGINIVLWYTLFFGRDLVEHAGYSCNGGSSADAGSRCEQDVQATCTGFAVAFVAATVGIDSGATILRTLLDVMTESAPRVAR
ncbi:hypothetical protein K437DRAFT_86901 [Tilletiaria anomala UBC 951]|uniref:Uncharacterized protein n=1 Tax=Tilletiaria anomala (strain ATCC 24038 / CBS 436.72 / UBC 951) TaxID=1037660 RepID=A0A066V0F6_TILAU|nr:uncharacterized protein K437DRAFT_86901 [Tilletiaria anomala UBC 951]KDN34936.1 hypothetical protein K437DRAFT_86901 [Tilletiaria anomala UBC 951]